MVAEIASIAPFKEVFGLVSVVLAFAGYLIYAIRLRSGIKPHAISWLIWGIVMSISFCGQWYGGGGPGAWATGLGAICTVVIFLCTAFRGDTKVHRFDWNCLGLAAFSILLWLGTSSPLPSMVLVTFIDVLGYLPTIRKIRISPKDEPLFAWILFEASWFFSILAIEKYNLVTIIYPGAILLMNSWLCCALVLEWRRRPDELRAAKLQ